MGEHPPYKREVTGSSPVIPITKPLLTSLLAGFFNLLNFAIFFNFSCSQCAVSSQKVVKTLESFARKCYDEITENKKETTAKTLES